MPVINTELHASEEWEFNSGALEAEKEDLTKVITEELKSEFAGRLYVSESEASVFAMRELAASERSQTDRREIAAEAYQRFFADTRLT